MNNLITLFAKRVDGNVNIYTKEGKLKAIFPKRGYRPTKRTKEITLNGWKFNLKWR